MKMSNLGLNTSSLWSLKVELDSVSDLKCIRGACDSL